jgi:hypothetical protein
MFKRLIIFAFSVALAGCTTTTNIKPVRPLTIDEAYGAVIEYGIRMGMKDPNSVIFGPSRAMELSDGNIAVCGYVNAKNSFGGYHGMVPYYGILSKKTHRFTLMQVGDAPAPYYDVNKICKQYGMPF